MKQAIRDLAEQELTLEKRLERIERLLQERLEKYEERAEFVARMGVMANVVLLPLALLGVGIWFYAYLAITAPHLPMIHKEIINGKAWRRWVGLEEPEDTAVRDEQ